MEKLIIISISAHKCLMYLARLQKKKKPLEILIPVTPYSQIQSVACINFAPYLTAKCLLPIHMGDKQK